MDWKRGNWPVAEVNAGQPLSKALTETGDLQAALAAYEMGIDVATEMAERLIAEGAPCLHFIAAWDGAGGRLGPMAEAVLWGLRGNRELAIRNLRPAEVAPARLAAVRPALDEAARRFAHEARHVGKMVGRDAAGDEVETCVRKGQVLRIGDRKSTRLNSSHTDISRMPSSA